MATGTEFASRVIIGPPGTGKTTALLAAAGVSARKWGPDRVVVAALTRAAAHEAAHHQGSAQFLPSSQIATLHAWAYRALGGPPIATGKALDTFSEAHPQWAMSGTEESIDDTALGEDRGPSIGQEHPGDEALSESERLRALCIPVDHWPGHLQMFHELWSTWKNENGLFDFSDLLEISLRDTTAAPGDPEIIYIDEAQDLSALEHKLVRHWGQAAGRVVLIGDPDQSLYCWRGAVPEELYDGAPEHRRTLSQSYRVPRAVLRHALSWIDRAPGRARVSYLARDEDGAVDRLPATVAAPWAVVRAVVDAIGDGRTVMVLTSTSYLLRATVRALKQAGVPYHNPFRRKRGDWNPLRARDRVLSYIRGADKPWTWAELWQWIEVFASKNIMEDGMKTKIRAFAKDKATANVAVGDDVESTIATLSDIVFGGSRDWWRPKTPSTLTADGHILVRRRGTWDYPSMVMEKFGRAALEQVPQVVVGTIHSVKGGQADVVIVFPDLSPRGYESWLTDPLSVYRLFYVAFTRAREKLLICDPAGLGAPI